MNTAIIITDALNNDNLVLTEAERAEILAKREREKQTQEIKELWKTLNQKMIEYGWHWFAGGHRIDSVDFYNKTLSLNIRR